MSSQTIPSKSKPPATPKWSERLANLFPYSSPEFVPVLLTFVCAAFGIQIFHAVVLNGWFAEVSDPFSMFWSAIWFVISCALYNTTIAPALERQHQNLGTFIHASCLYSFFAGTLLCLQIIIRNFQ